MILPKLLWKPSPNVSARAAPVDLIVVHDCQGSYAGSIATFMDPHNRNAHGQDNPVSAHFVLKDDASEATQMVSLDRKAWHCTNFNSRSIGVEMAGFAERGFPDAEWDGAARIVAYLLHRYGLPCRWAQHGAGPGFTSHFDLGKAGGGHSDPTTVPGIWQGFVARVQKTYAAGGFPTSWARGEPASGAASPPAQADIRDVFWLQTALNRLGADPVLDVDGQLGPATIGALMPLQFRLHVPKSGKLDAATIAAVETALAALSA